MRIMDLEHMITFLVIMIPCHGWILLILLTYTMLQWSRTVFNVNLISRFGCLQWPVRSLDIVLLGFLHWGYLKVYKNRPQTFQELKNKVVQNEIDDLNCHPEMLKVVMENFHQTFQELTKHHGECLLLRKYNFKKLRYEE